jgi:hypothetical protein
VLATGDGSGSRAWSRIRARARAGPAALRDRHRPDLEIVESDHTDHRFRAFVLPDEWTDAGQMLAADIDYPNVKSAVAERQG